MTSNRVLALLVTVVLVASCGRTGEPTSGDLEARLAAAGRVEAAAQDGDRSIARVEPAETMQRPVVEIPDRWPSEIEAVYGRYWLYWEAFAAAHGPPRADPTYGPLRELSSAGNWDSLQAQLRAFAADGLVLEPPSGSITEHLIRIPDTAVLTGDEGEEVVLQDCWIDDFIQRTVDGIEVARSEEARLMNVVMKVIDGEWRVDGVSRATPETEGVEQCADLIE